MFSKRYSARQLFGNFYKEAAPELFDRLRWQENNYFSLATGSGRPQAGRMHLLSGNIPILKSLSQIGFAESFLINFRKWV